MNYVDRMINELSELQNRFSKLEKFYNENNYNMDYAKRLVMLKQRKIMLDYIDILVIRLKMEGVDIK